jgi:hypothetical protein
MVGNVDAANGVNGPARRKAHEIPVADGESGTTEDNKDQQAEQIASHGAFVGAYHDGI